MSNAGQGVSAVIGGIIGFMIGGPTGAMYGFQLGLLAGTALFPTQLPDVIGPRLEDFAATTAQVGTPVPDTWGTIAVLGTVIWLGQVVEIATTEEVGGKGSPEQSVTSFTYFQSIAVGLRASTHRPIQGILRIWENGKLVYDVRDQQPGETADEFNERTAASSAYRAGFELYLGTSDQMPDPTIEAVEGVGNVPGFRDLAYVVFPNRQLLDEQARRHPQWRFEIYDGVGERDYIVPTFLSDPVLTDFDTRTVITDWNHGRYVVIDNEGDFQGLREFRISDNTETRQITFEEALPGRLHVADLWILGAATSGYLGHIYFPWFTTGSNVAVARINPDTLVIDGELIVGGATDFWHEAVTMYIPGYFDFIVAVSDSGARFSYYDGYQMTGGVFWEPGGGYSEGKVCSGPTDLLGRVRGYALAFDPDPTTSEPALIRTITAQFGMFALAIDVEHQLIGSIPPADIDASWTRYTDCPLFLFDSWDQTVLIGFNGGPPGSTTERLIKWDPETGAILWNIATNLPSSTTSMNGGRLQNHYLAWPLVTFTRYLDTRDGTFVDIEWDDEGQVGGFEGSHVFDGGTNRMIAWDASLGPVVLEFGNPSAEDVSLATIVTDVCGDCGLSPADIDIADLTTRFVHGYARTRPMSGRACIEPLRMIGFFDCVESSGILKWPTRGKATVATIDSEELGAHEYEADGGPGITTKKLQSIELPRMMRVHYIAPSLA